MKKTLNVVLVLIFAAIISSCQTASKETSGQSDNGNNNKNFNDTLLRRVIVEYSLKN